MQVASAACIEGRNGMEEMRCNDIAFGEMCYKHRWYKKQYINIFGKEWEITIAAKAYSGKAITEDQRRSYLLFMENEKEYVKAIGEELKTYVNDNFHELAEFWTEAKTVGSTEDLSQMVAPKTLLFKQDGSVIMLLDCVWDVENGIGVKLIPELVIGVQDLFL